MTQLDMVRFDDEEIASIVANMNEKDLDTLPFGAVQVDEQGRILKFNKTEGDIVGTKADDVIGKNFFSEVAPCAQVPEFEGRFQEGVRSGDLSVIFEFEYDYGSSPVANAKPHVARIHMKKAIMDGTYWIFAKRIQ